LMVVDTSIGGSGLLGIVGHVGFQSILHSPAAAAMVAVGAAAAVVGAGSDVAVGASWGASVLGAQAANIVADVAAAAARRKSRRFIFLLITTSFLNTETWETWRI